MASEPFTKPTLLTVAVTTAVTTFFGLFLQYLGFSDWLIKQFRNA